MKSFFLCLAIFIAAIPSAAQVEFIPEDYFPADFEFEELRGIQSEISFSDSKQLSDIENGALIQDVGFDNYDRRTYSVSNSGTLSIEIVTLTDFHAAYSLLTLLRTSDIQPGPPGDAFASDSDRFIFYHGRRWIRIRGNKVTSDLLRRVAVSVANRIGVPNGKIPSLVSYLPEPGLAAGSLRYFPGAKPYESYRSAFSPSVIATYDDVEIVLADYAIEGRSATLALIKFPTAPLADECFDAISSSPEEKRTGIYLKKSGPLLCVLEGPFNSVLVGDVLRNVQYSYSVHWDQQGKTRPKITWGIPVVILNTTVWSFFLVLFICVFSILAGAGIAAFRLLLRYYVPRNPWDDPNRTEITRLKLP